MPAWWALCWSTSALAGAPLAGGGDVHVLPTLRLHREVQPDATSPIGLELNAAQLQLRAQRAQQLDRLYEHLSWALAGEVNGALGEAWPGRFVRTDYARGQRRILETVVLAHAPPDPALAAVGRRAGGAAVLVSWIDALSAEPMTLRAMPGEVVDTPVGPVVVDATNEPYRVRASIGVAVVDADGRVIVSSHATYDAVMRGERGVETAALELSQAVAETLLPAWRVPDGPDALAVGG